MGEYFSEFELDLLKKIRDTEDSVRYKVAAVSEANSSVSATQNTLSDKHIALQKATKDLADVRQTLQYFRVQLGEIFAPSVVASPETKEFVPQAEQIGRSV